MCGGVLPLNLILEIPGDSCKMAGPGKKSKKSITKHIVLDLEKTTCTQCSKTLLIYKMAWILYTDGKYRVLDICNNCYSTSVY